MLTSMMSLDYLGDLMINDKFIENRVAALVVKLLGSEFIPTIKLFSVSLGDEELAVGEILQMLHCCTFCISYEGGRAEMVGVVVDFHL